MTPAAAITRFANRPRARAFLSNPVVVRDLRAQMRGARSFWYMGAYLLLLGILSIAGYAASTGQILSPSSELFDSGAHVNIIDAQSQLSGLYRFIFLTIAALICLIAPALTASSIVGERQRLSLDLLITTPLRAGELLVGKLLSSIAFLGMLLVLSLPASTLCVTLGSATLGDVLRVYALLALSGIVMAGIGLYFSCAVRTSLLALIWTYVAVALFVGVTAALATSIPGSSSSNVLPLIGAVALLNPFFAVMSSSYSGIQIAGAFTMPYWLGAAASAALILTLLVTAGAYRLGSYGGAYGVRLRKLAFVSTALASFLMMSAAKPSRPVDIASLGVVAFIVLSPFLAGLFVPASREDAPPGTAEETAVSGGRLGAYRFTAAFRPYHAGALPYYHLLLIAMAVGAAVGIYSTSSMSLSTVATGMALTVVYLAALGFLYWTVSRWAAGVARGLSGARALSFGTMIMIAMVPVLIAILMPAYLGESLLKLCIFHPITVAPIPAESEAVVNSELRAIALSVVLGLIFAGIGYRQAKRRNGEVVL